MTDSSGAAPTTAADPPPPMTPESFIDPEIDAIPRNVAALIRFRGWTERQVFEAIGVGESGWTRRKHNPGMWTYQQIRRLAKVLGVEVSRLTQVEP